MNQYITSDLVGFDREEKMKKVREIFCESWEQDFVRFWFDDFPEGPSLILGVGGNTSSSDAHTALFFEFHKGIFEKDYPNWSTLAKDMLENIHEVPWFFAGLDDENMNAEDYFEGQDEIEVFKAFISTGLDPAYLFRENANPIAKWLMDKRGY